MATPRAGSSRPATLGGAQFRRREADHRREVANGQLWTPCGYRSESDRLTDVVLAWPPGTLDTNQDPDSFLMLDRVDLERMRRQTSAIAEAFRSFGVRVHLFDADHAPPNLVFMRDLFFATEEGVIVGRMGAAQRAGEERFATSALAGLGVPILATVGGTGTFEGADALWLDSSTVILGVGFRTNLQGAETVSGILSTLAVRTVAVDLPRGVQHLLGAVTFLDRDLVAVHGGAADDALWQRLEAHGYECLVLPPDDELVVGRGMNLVALAPRKVLMPGGCPGIRRQLASRGVEAHEVELSEYLKAAGGLGCVTGILRREAIGPSLTDPDPLPLKRGHHDGNER